MLKRVFDFNLSLVALLLLWPFMLLVTVLVRIHLGSGVLFRQVRAGLHGKPFTVLKFRTMTTACDAQGRLLPDQDRLPLFGRLLRTTSLDELPQLFCVLRGEMSLVGPRPLLWSYIALYTPEQARRLEVRPGITGWAQVMGRNALSWEEKFKLDVWYVDNRSFWLDLKILWKTIGTVLSAQGISQEGEATTAEFTGSYPKEQCTDKPIS